MDEQTIKQYNGCVAKILRPYIASGAINDLSDEEIAKIHDLKVSTVARFRRRNGIKHRRGPKPVKKGGDNNAG